MSSSRKHCHVLINLSLKEKILLCSSRRHPGSTHFHNAAPTSVPLQPHPQWTLEPRPGGSCSDSGTIQPLALSHLLCCLCPSEQPLFIWPAMVWWLRTHLFGTKLTYSVVTTKHSQGGTVLPPVASEQGVQH